MIEGRPEAWKRTRILGLATALFFLAGTGAASQDGARPGEPLQPDPAKGYKLADRLCRSCHLVDGPAAISVPAGVPSLRSLANQPGQTGQRIRNALVRPAHPMPDMALSIQEIADLIAYLDELRTDKTAPPLIEQPLRRDKPKHPAPS